MFVPPKIIESKLLQLLSDDIGQGDVSTAAVISQGVVAEALVIAKEAGVAAGIEEVTILSESLGLKAEGVVSDGAEIKKGQGFLRISGDARTILSA
jgi:nicotinate-nucleotide pyrophosphorylase (carboxylating)